MPHTVESLLPIIYHYYPRGMHCMSPLYRTSKQYQRLLALRKEAGTGERRANWEAMVERLRARLPECAFEDRTLLYPPNHDTGYHVRIYLNPKDKSFARMVVGWVSAIIPCYIVYSSSGSTARGEGPFKIRYDFTPEEQPVADILTAEIEATYGYERLPPEIGTVSVPDLCDPSRAFGDNNIYELLFIGDTW